MNPTFTIRRARPEDAPAIAAVHVSSWRTTYPGIVEQAYIDRLSKDERAAAWARRLSESEDAPDILVAESSEELVGFVSGGRIRAPELGFDAELHAIYLLARVQRHGLGTRLVNGWADVAVRRGFRAAVVRVLAENPARLFYQQLGAQLVKQSELEIGRRSYPELWYGWSDLRTLAIGSR